MMRGRLVVVLHAVWLAGAACTRPPEQSAEASLVELSRQPPDANFQRIGPVSCRADDAATPKDGVERCQSDLRSEAAKLDADLVVIERETGPSRGCPGCVEMHGYAYRRQLPWERAAPNTTRVEVTARAKLSSGTGFVVAPNGVVLTANHVVEGARTIAVSLAGNRHAIARVARRFAESDVALLQIDWETPNYLSLRDSTTVAVGQRVWTMGFPVVGFLGVEPKFTDGSISALTGPDDAPEVFQVTVPIQPGNSGGPLVTDEGDVIGIITSSAAALPFLRATGTLPQGINWAVKADFAKRLFDEPPRIAQASSRADAVERVRKAVCLVEAVEGEGLPLAPRGFGEGILPKTVASGSFERLRGDCNAGNVEACLSVARVIVAECNTAVGACRHLGFARTTVAHACAVGRATACDVLRDHRD